MCMYVRLLYNVEIALKYAYKKRIFYCQRNMQESMYIDPVARVKAG